MIKKKTHQKTQASHKGNRTNKILLVFVAAVILVDLFIISYDYYNLVSVKEYSISFAVVESNQIGFNLNTSELVFGSIPRGGSAVRSIIVEHQFSEPLFVEMTIGGPAKEMVGVSDNNFVLERNTEKLINVTVSVPENATLGNYSADLTITLKRT